MDRSLVAVFGGETRLKVLAVLANAHQPFTGYRVAKTAGIRPPKAYAELRRLEAVGVVGRESGRWVILDRDLFFLLRKRARVHWLEDLRAPDATSERFRHLTLRAIRANGASLGKEVLEYDPARRREKDELLVATGKRPSPAYRP